MDAIFYARYFVRRKAAVCFVPMLQLQRDSVQLFDRAVHGMPFPQCVPNVWGICEMLKNKNHSGDGIGDDTAPLEGGRNRGPVKVPSGYRIPRPRIGFQHLIVATKVDQPPPVAVDSV